MFFAIFALAYGETVNSKWRVQIEEKLEETLQTIQNNKDRIKKQSKVFKKQTNAIQKQAVEIENLRQRIKALEGQSANLNNKVEGCLTVHLKMEPYHRQWKDDNCTTKVY